MSYLDDLLDGARRRVSAAAAHEPLDALRARARRVPPGPSLAAALGAPGVQVVAEVKRASPSRGALAAGLDAAEQARAYAAGGAAAVSVLTEPDRFDGSLDDLAAVAALGVPALRKDFVLDPYQVWEARAAGASAVLLIVAALTPATLAELLDTCRAAGVEALVEVHTPAEAEVAARAGARIVGVNSRDLETFDVDREAFSRVRPLLPAGVVVIAESGVHGPDDVRAAARDGADAVLVGESVVTAADPRAAVAALVDAGQPASERG